MNSLLKPLDQYTPSERGDVILDESPDIPYTDSPRESIDEEPWSGTTTHMTNSTAQMTDSTLDVMNTSTSGTSSPNANGKPMQRNLAKKTNGQVVLDDVHPPQVDGVSTRPRPPLRRTTTSGAPDWMQSVGARLEYIYAKLSASIRRKARNTFESFPKTLQNALYAIWRIIAYIGSCLNVPLVAILLSVVVALVPPLQRFFFTHDTFVNNSVTAALAAMGNVAVPLILVVLGANLARNTLPEESVEEVGTKSEQAKMLWLSLTCRMLIPTVVMTPLLAILAKYAPVSIIDDPIFLIVCFLLCGAPSALQLAQMCQVNGVFVGVVSRLLFHSYVIWILPSTLALVLLALECVEWAK